MLILTASDLKALLNSRDLRRVLSQVRNPDEEVFLYVCSVDKVYFGFVKLDEAKFVDFDRFVPSQVYLNTYTDLPDGEILPCPLCGHRPSVVRLENVGGKVSVYSS